MRGVSVSHTPAADDVIFAEGWLGEAEPLDPGGEGSLSRGADPGV